MDIWFSPNNVITENGVVCSPVSVYLQPIRCYKWVLWGGRDAKLLLSHQCGASVCLGHPLKRQRPLLGCTGHNGCVCQPTYCAPVVCFELVSRGCVTAEAGRDGLRGRGHIQRPGYGSLGLWVVMEALHATVGQDTTGLTVLFAERAVHQPVDI